MSAAQDTVTRFQECIDAMATESGWTVQSDGKLRALYGRMRSGWLCLREDWLIASVAALPSIEPGKPSTRVVF